MSLIQVSNLDKFYGAEPILQNLDLEIHPGEKWGLIGRNGCGKTTLIRILAGKEDYDRGEIGLAQNCRIGYLEQEPNFETKITIYQELRNLFQDLDQLHEEIERARQQISDHVLNGEQLDRLVEEHYHLSQEYEQKGGFLIEGRIQGVLRGLGFPKERWTDSVAVLSGGERSRLALAKILLSSYDLLLLDEPTNYLDMTAIEWLEEYLKLQFKGAALIISHDRFFLDRVVQGIFELDSGKIKRYRGNYTDYRNQKELNLQAQAKAYQIQQKYLQKQEKFIREAGASEKSKRKANSVKKRLQKVERIHQPSAAKRSLKICFTGHEAGGREVLLLEGLSKGFDSKSIFRNVNLRVEYGDRIGLIGPNGAGKTTLIKMILGLDSPDTGRIRLGYEVYPGYFPQIVDDSGLSGTPFQMVMDMADLDNTEARTILGRFLFSGDDVFKNVADLSGGERRRLSLIKLMLSKSNLLILDEPTNHLDLESIEAIEKALVDFDGTIMVVSHDRYFLNKVVDRYLAVLDENLIPFDSYQDYLDANHSQAKQGTTSKYKNEAQVRREQNKEFQRELKRKQRRLEQTETEIEELETEKEKVSDLLNDPSIYADYNKSLALSKDLAEIETKLAEAYRVWEELSIELSANKVE
jgi:ATP-binding cassette subfamily F protein 3